MCLLASVTGLLARSMPIDILAQIGFVVLVGLAAKNAILIVEFAHQREHEGATPLEGAVHAARTRLRPILMTSFAFILGVAPFSLTLPHVGLVGTVILTVFIGIILASAFSAILVYAQELVPGKVGMIAGLFFGLAFGIAGIGSAALGQLADHTSIEFVFSLCAFLPLIGLLTVLLPDIEPHHQRAKK